MKRLLFFIHIAKTGGTTFSAILNRNFRRSRVINVDPGGRLGVRPEGFRDLPDEVRSAVECVKGHFDFGLHRFVDRPFVYATFLRNPVEQVRSRYNHVRSSRFHPLHHLVRAGMPLEEWVKRSPDNYQTRSLLEIPMRPGRERPPVTERHLEEAKANVERHFAGVGITERFDESVLLLRRPLGLDRVHYVRRNVRRRAAPPPLDPATRLEIERSHRLDLDLYAWAAERLDRQVREGGDSLRRALEEFERGNARYSRVMRLPDRLLHRLDQAARLLRHARSRGRPAR